MSDGMTPQQQQPPKNTLCIWGLVVDMVNNNVDRNYSKFKYLPHLRFKKLQNHLHEISLVKGFSILPKSLP
jgi:hypothetical protein